jgi:hypothetical protein
MLGFHLRNFRGSNVGITDEMDLWAHMTWYKYHVPWQLVKEFKQYSSFSSEIWEAILLVLQSIPRNGFMWHDIHIKFHEDWHWRSSQYYGITSAIWEAVVLVLLRGGTYEVRCWDGLKWHDEHTKFRLTGSGILVIFRLTPHNLRGYSVTITDGRDLWCMLLRWLHMVQYVFQV